MQAGRGYARQGGRAVKSLMYSCGFLGRASERRSDPGWVAMILDGPGTRLIPIWRDHCLVSGDPPGPVTSLEGGRSKPVREVSAELAQRPATGRSFGRVDSIDRHLLQSWLNRA